MGKLKKFPVSSVLLLLLVFSFVQNTDAQLFGLLHSAKPVRHSSLVGGGYLLLAGGADIGVVGQLRYGASRNLDLGGKLGYLSEGDGGIMLGGDVMGQIIHSGKDSPFNLSLDGSLELFFVENVTLFAISGIGIVDDEFRLENDKLLRPYGALALDIVTVDFDNPGFGQDSNTELDISIIGGVVYGISSQIELLGELQITSVDGADVGINVGLNFR